MRHDDDEIRYAHCMGKATGLLEAATHLKDLAVALSGVGAVAEAYLAEADECVRRSDGYHKQAQILTVKEAQR